MVNEHSKWSTSILDEVVNEGTVARAIHSLGPWMAARPDGIFPSLLQKSFVLIKAHLVPLFKAYLMFGYVPTSWLAMRVVFIPKPGKDSYERASSWRPISLMSFMLKTLERLVDWHLRTPSLEARLRESGQHAYIRGGSCDSALHQVVARIERTLKSREIALAVFIDIEGAFSHATFAALLEGLRRVGVDAGLIRWIGFMLKSRTVAAEYQEVKCTKVVERGYPQGGVLSPLLWDLVIDELLLLLKEKAPNIFAPGFADDLLLLQRGIDITVIRDLMLDALEIVYAWCVKTRFAFNPDKFKAMVFTLKRKVKCQPLTVQGKHIPLVTSVRYLGVNLDPRLSWTFHIKAKVKKFAQCKRAVGKNWGFSPKIMLWIYTAVIRRALTYGSLVWLPAVSVKKNVLILTKVQRLALLSIFGVMKSTPTSALQGLLGLCPIDLQVEGVALGTMHRLKCQGQWLHWAGFGSVDIKKRTHIEYVEDYPRVGTSL